MRAIVRLATSGTCVLLAGCSEPGVPPDCEVAAELRALRAVLVQQAKVAGGTVVGSNAVPGQLATALQPLREVLDGLVQTQRDLQTRQVTLTQEMQRWSQLLVETAKGAQHEEAQALAQRLQQLEKTLHEQDARHREVESLVQGALDRTADRLEDFLRRLEGMQPGSAQPPLPAGVPPDPAIKTPAGPGPGGGTGQPGTPAGGASPPAAGGGEDHGTTPGGTSMARTTRSPLTFWWMLPAVLAAGLGVAFFLRLRRLSHRPFASKSQGAGPEVAESPREPEIDRGVQEIWAAAALLGEAVGRLKQTAASEAKPAQPPPAMPDDGVDLSEVFVLDDELVNGVEPPAPAAAAAAPPPPKPVRGSHAPMPATAVRFRLPGLGAGRTQTELLRLLDEDPRVLRRPAPVVAATPTAIEVAFHVLPALPASERSQIEQRLRDAIA